jgi:hypothetical protein
MKNPFFEYFSLSLGIILSVLSVFFLHKFVQNIEIDLEFLSSSFDEFSIFGPYLFLGLVSGFTGIPLFLKSITVITNKKE